MGCLSDPQMVCHTAHYIVEQGFETRDFFIINSLSFNIFQKYDTTKLHF